jgi:hypothetical protein
MEQTNFLLDKITMLPKSVHLQSFIHFNSMQHNWISVGVQAHGFVGHPSEASEMKVIKIIV